MSALTYFPVVENRDDLTDILSRAAWFLAKREIDRIYLPIRSSDLAETPWHVTPGMDAAIAENFESLKQKLVFVVAQSGCDLDACMRKSSVILHWKKDAPPDFVSNGQIKAWEEGKKVWQVDPVAVRMEGSSYINAGFQLVQDKASLIAENREKFKRLSEKLGKFERAYLMATGPSVANYRKFDYTNALSIVCNSVILDEELMDTVRPQILVFADPIFHFGPSQYAASFRAKLLDSSRKHDYTICIPFNYYPLFVSAMPELAERTVGIPFLKDREFNFDLTKDFQLKTTANILTFLMVPLAATFADEIAFLGCDGRPLQENTYFWKHNQNTQFNDKMANIRDIHPGFFNIDYNDYYLEHCRLLAEQLEAGERIGLKFRSLAFSHIPALSQRSPELPENNRPTGKDNEQETDNATGYPRLLVIDSTRVGSSSATGQLKKNLLCGWPEKALRQLLYAGPTGPFRVARSLANESSDITLQNEKSLLAEIRNFDPEVLYYRPYITRHPGLYRAAVMISEELGVPLVSHIMDDWPSQLGSHDSRPAEEMDARLKQLFHASRKALCISEEMSAEFRKRYGVNFEPIANGISPDIYRSACSAAEAVKIRRKAILVRYCGALADNMTLQTLIDVAHAIDSLQAELNIRLEVYTTDHWRHPFASVTEGLRGVSVLNCVPDEAYPRLLAEADILVIGYNFDEESVRYIRYSMPNKLPEYLASGAAVLAIGPAEAAGINYLLNHGLAHGVTRRSIEALVSAIRQLATNHEYRRVLGRKGQEWAFRHHDIEHISARFRKVLREAAKPAPDSTDIAHGSTAMALSEQFEVASSMQASNVVLIFYPTRATPIEQSFWKLFIAQLKDRGYSPIIVSFFHDKCLADCPKIYVSNSLRLLGRMSDFSSHQEEFLSLAEKFRRRNGDQQIFDALVESNLSYINEPDVRASNWYKDEATTGAGIYVGYLIHLIRELRPVKAIVNNDTLPIQLIARHCAEYLSVPVIHSERSPITNQWFEADGFYAKSSLTEFLAERVWDQAGPHESLGAAIIEKLRAAPAGHRELPNALARPKAQLPRKASGKLRFLLAMDATHNTGWSLKTHPLRPINYPLFGSPEEAVSRLAALSRKFNATLVVKPHPSDDYVKRMKMPNGVELSERDIKDELHDADIVFCFLTKVAFVAMAWGKPVVILGPNIAALSGVTFHCTTVEEIEAKIAQALKHSFDEEFATRTARFIGYLGQHYFVNNDLDNPGSARLLDVHFRRLPAVDRRVLRLNESLRGINVLAPDAFAPELGISPTKVNFVYGPFDRVRDRRMDEIQIVADLLERDAIRGSKSSRTMIDVGACQGSAFEPFLKSGWTIHAFEPNLPMVEKLKKKFGNDNRLVINPLAVSDVSGERKPFYTSEESIGISSLLAFRSTHRQSAVVETVRLDDYCARRGVADIDFLKVDTEGFDLPVLKSLDWDRFRPRAVLCEFENAKTINLGYRYEDLADFLHKLGYQVFVSEWHPITKYGGGEHRWRAMHLWPTALLDANAWGNLIAFREPVAAELVRLASEQVAYQQWKKFASKQRAGELAAALSVSKASSSTASPASPMKSSLLAERAFVRLNKPPPHGNWRPAGEFEDWRAYCWSQPGARSTIELTVRRDRETLAVVAYYEPFDQKRLAGLRIEVDGVPVPYEVHTAVRPKCIVARVPARPGHAGPTMLSVVMPAPAGPEQTEGGLGVIWVALIPAAPLQLPSDTSATVRGRRSAWRKKRWQALSFPLSHFDGLAYMKTYPDVADAVRSGIMPSALEHYRRHGREDDRRFALAHFHAPNEGTFPDIFDGRAYLNAHPDAADAVRCAVFPTALEHYVQYGRDRGYAVTVRLDGRGSLGTTFDLLQREIAAGKQALSVQVKSLKSALARIQDGLILTARAADLEHLKRNTIRKLDRMLGDIKTALTVRETREQAVLEQIELLRISLDETQRRLALTSRSEEIDRLKRNVALDIERVRSEVASFSSIENAREQALLEQINALKSDVSAAKVHAELAEVKMVSTQTELGTETRQIAGSISGLGDGIATTRQDVNRLQEELQRIKDQTAGHGKRINHPSLGVVNILGYQAHPRTLQRAAVDRLLTHWAPLLRQNLHDKELYYLAHRVYSLESINAGRLAASINDMLLRILVARSIQSSNVEIMEIGSLFGTGIGVLQETLSPMFDRVHFTAIDPLDGYYGKGNRDILTGVPISRSVFDHNLRRMGVPAGDVTLIQRLSTDPRALQQARKNHYDMLIIDGDHSAEGVRNDAEKFVTLVRSGGYVIFDDYGNPHWPAVKRYVDAEVMPRKDLKFVGAEWHTAVFQVTS